MYTYSHILEVMCSRRRGCDLEREWLVMQTLFFLSLQVRRLCMVSIVVEMYLSIVFCLISAHHVLVMSVIAFNW